MQKKRCVISVKLQCMQSAIWALWNCGESYETVMKSAERTSWKLFSIFYVAVRTPEPLYLEGKCPIFVWSHSILEKFSIVWQGLNWLWQGNATQRRQARGTINQQIHHSYFAFIYTLLPNNYPHLNFFSKECSHTAINPNSNSNPCPCFFPCCWHCKLLIPTLTNNNLTTRPILFSDTIRKKSKKSDATLIEMITANVW